MVLQTFAGILKSNIESKGIAARFGGEEFMLVFNNSDRDEITKVITECSTELKEFSMNSKEFELTFSG